MKLEFVTFNPIRKIFSCHVILQAYREEQYEYRCRLMRPIVFVLHIITAVIGPEATFHATWQLAWSSFSASFPWLAGQSLLRRSVSKAHKRLPRSVWQRLTQ